jgi:Domain of unknown function (DUF397)
VNDRYILSYARSSFCGGGHCVEVAPLPDGQVAVRDSKDSSAPDQVYTPAEWVAFVRGVKAGEFDFGLTTHTPETVLIS